MIVEELVLSGVFVLKPELIEDSRGYFFREFCKSELEISGITINEIVQVNRSFNKGKGTFRGLHYQCPPFAEEKIITCLNGRVADVIVDLRKDSNTFLSHTIVELSEKNRSSVLIPMGCAHGFITLEENVELLYLHTNYYNPQSESGYSIFDPLLKIKLPTTIKEISQRDQTHKLLSKNFKGLVI